MKLSQIVCPRGAWSSQGILWDHAKIQDWSESSVQQWKSEHVSWVSAVFYFVIRSCYCFGSYCLKCDTYFTIYLTLYNKNTHTPFTLGYCNCFYGQHQHFVWVTGSFVNIFFPGFVLAVTVWCDANFLISIILRIKLCIWGDFQGLRFRKRHAFFLRSCLMALHKACLWGMVLQYISYG